jgi:hypothetical protein
MMELFVATVFAVLALAVWLTWVLGNQYVKILALLLLLPWGYYAQWWGRVLWDIRLVDDASSRFIQDKLLDAVNHQQQRVLLVSITPFKWYAMCAVWGGSDDANDLELKEVFKGKLLNTYFKEMNAWSDIPYPIFATPDGPYLLQPFWGRFTEHFQARWNGRYYARKLAGKSYTIELEMEHVDKSVKRQKCFKPNEVWVWVKPEPVNNTLN